MESKCPTQSTVERKACQTASRCKQTSKQQLRQQAALKDEEETTAFCRLRCVLWTKLTCQQFFASESAPCSQPLVSCGVLYETH